MSMEKPGSIIGRIGRIVIIVVGAAAILALVVYYFSRPPASSSSNEPFGAPGRPAQTVPGG